MKEWSLRGWYSVVCAGTHSKGNWPIEAQEVQKNRSRRDMKANFWNRAMDLTSKYVVH